MVKHLRHVHPVECAKLQGNNKVNTKAGKKKVPAFVLEVAKKLAVFFVCRLSWVKLAPIVNKHGQQMDMSAICGKTGLSTRPVS